MRRINYFQCNECGFMTKSINEMIDHEALHTGLVSISRDDWNEIEVAVEEINAISKLDCNEATNAAIADAINKCIECGINMREITTFKCDYCVRITVGSFRLMQIHEAAHFGLSRKQMETWQDLKSNVLRTKSLSDRNNVFENDFITAVNECFEFEVKNGLESL